MSLLWKECHKQSIEGPIQDQYYIVNKKWLLMFTTNGPPTTLVGIKSEMKHKTSQTFFSIGISV